MASCPKCNKEVSENAQFCPDCGATLNTVDTTTDNTPVSVSNIQQNNQWTNNRIIKLVVILILICLTINFTTGFKSTSIKDKTSSPNIIDGLTLESYKVENAKFSTFITGVVSAHNDYFDKGAFVKVRFYDSDKNFLSEGQNASSALHNGDNWKFSIYVPDDVASYEITTVGMLI